MCALISYIAILGGKLRAMITYIINKHTRNNTTPTTGTHQQPPLTRIVRMVLHDIILHALLADQVLLAEPVNRFDRTGVEQLLRDHVHGVA